MVAVVIDGQQCRIAARLDEAVLHEVVELHQLHVLVRLFGPRPDDLQRAADAVGIVGAQALFVVVADLEQGRCGVQRHQVRFHFLDEIRVLGERLAQAAAVGGHAHAEVVADLVPERAVEAAVDRQVIAKRRRHDRVEALLAVLENRRVRQDVVANQHDAAVLAGVIRIVRQDRRGVGAACLTEIGDDVVDADGNVRAHPLLVLVGQGVLDRLQFGHRGGKRPALRLVACQQAGAVERLDTEQGIVVGLVASELQVQLAEAAGHPRCIARLVIAGEQITAAVAQIRRKIGRVICDGAGRPLEMPSRLDELWCVGERIRNGIQRGRILVERLESLAQTGVQCLDRRILAQPRQIGGYVFRAGAPDCAAHCEQRIPCRRVRFEKGIDLLARQTARVDVLSGIRGIDRQERQPFVVERRRDRSLEEVIEVEQVLRRVRCCRRRMQVLETLFCHRRFGVKLLLVERVHDAAGLEQCLQRLQFGGREVPEIRAQRYLEPGIENRLRPFRRPVAIGQLGSGSRCNEQEAASE